MIRPGDVVLLRYDDQEENQGVVGRELRVLALDGEGHPFWMTVTDGERSYYVRGSDCSLRRLYGEEEWVRERLR